MPRSTTGWDKPGLERSAKLNCCQGTNTRAAQKASGTNSQRTAYTTGLPLLSTIITGHGLDLTSPPQYVTHMSLKQQPKQHTLSAQAQSVLSLTTLLLALTLVQLPTRDTATNKVRTHHCSAPEPPTIRQRLSAAAIAAVHGVLSTHSLVPLTTLSAPELALSTRCAAATTPSKAASTLAGIPCLAWKNQPKPFNTTACTVGQHIHVYLVVYTNCTATPHECTPLSSPGQSLPGSQPRASGPAVAEPAPPSHAQEGTSTLAPHHW